MNMNDEFEDILERFLNQERMYHLEGDRGLEHLNNLANTLGYQRSGFMYGSSLERFLSDNPGAQQAIVDWISNQNVEQWKFDLLQNLAPDDEEE